MQFSHFFIRRPIFAGVIAIIITIVGAFAYIGLPVSQFPDIVPPTVTVSTNYPGASAETVADTVAAPIEQQINGVAAKAPPPSSPSASQATLAAR